MPVIPALRKWRQKFKVIHDYIAGLGPIYPNEFLSQQTIKTTAKTAEILPNSGISCILLTWRASSRCVQSSRPWLLPFVTRASEGCSVCEAMSLALHEGDAACQAICWPVGHCSCNLAIAVAKRTNILTSQVGVLFHPIRMTGPGSVLRCVVVVSLPRYASQVMNKI